MLKRLLSHLYASAENVGGSIETNTLRNKTTSRYLYSLYMLWLLHSMQLVGWVAASREKESHNPIDECCREDMLSTKSCRIFPHVLDHCGKVVAKFQ